MCVSERARGRWRERKIHGVRPHNESWPSEEPECISRKVPLHTKIIGNPHSCCEENT